MQTIQEFVNKMMDSEQSQLQLFVNYIINSNLDDELQNLDLKVLVIQWTFA
jgi:predicted outer membrane protein